MKYSLLLCLNISLLSVMAQDSGSKLPRGLLQGYPPLQEPKIEKHYEVVDGIVNYVYIADVGSSRSILRKMFRTTGLDADGFVIVKHIYARDRTKVYRMADKLPGADPGSFRVLNTVYSRDAVNVYYYDRIIVHADAGSFRLMDQKTTGSYSKDKNNVYLDGVQINGADPQTFDPFSYPYSKDKNRIYQYRDIIKDADLKNFQTMGEYYSKDSRYVYYNGKMIPGANPETFSIISYLYSKDDRSVYIGTQKITHADPGTFHLYLPSFYAKDYKNVFYKENVIKGINVKSISYPVFDELISDDKSLFHKEEKIEGVDISAFEIDHHYGAIFVYDRQYIYYKGRKEKIDLKSFTTYTNVRPPMDKNYIYLLEETGIRKIENNQQNRQKYIQGFNEGFNELLEKN